MITILRAIGVIGLVFGLFISSISYWSPGIEQQQLMAGCIASQNKDAFDRDHPAFRRLPNEDEKTDQLISVIYGLGIALVGVGLVLISYKMETKVPTNAAF